MILTKYFLKQYLKYLLIINSSLTLLFNFIEFFEKMVRVKHASLKIVSQFILLNIVPSFFQTLSISCWLATCLLLKEFFQQNEWETFKIINVNYSKIFNLFFTCGTIVFITSVLGQEFITLKLQNNSEKFKQEKFKQKPRQEIMDKWFQITEKNLNKRRFCHIKALDLQKEKGFGLTILQMSPKMELEKMIKTKNFCINMADKTIIMDSAIKTKIKEGCLEKLYKKTKRIPNLFSQLKLENQTPTTPKMIERVVFEKKNLPFQIWKKLLLDLIKRVFSYLQIIVYPLITFGLFAIFDSKKIKWFAIFFPYPMIILSDLIIDFIASKNLHECFFFAPYLIIFIAIIIIKKNLDKIF